MRYTLRGRLQHKRDRGLSHTYIRYPALFIPDSLESRLFHEIPTMGSGSQIQALMRLRDAPEPADARVTTDTSDNLNLALKPGSTCNGRLLRGGAQIPSSPLFRSLRFEVVLCLTVKSAHPGENGLYIGI